MNEHPHWNYSSEGDHISISWLICKSFTPLRVFANFLPFYQVQTKAEKNKHLRLVFGRPELRWRGGLDGLLRGGAAAVAAHDWKPGGAAGVHFDAAIQHAQAQHMRREKRSHRERGWKGPRRGEAMSGHDDGVKKQLVTSCPHPSLLSNQSCLTFIDVWPHYKVSGPPVTAAHCPKVEKKKIHIQLYAPNKHTKQRLVCLSSSQWLMRQTSRLACGRCCKATRSTVYRLEHSSF